MVTDFLSDFQRALIIALLWENVSLALVGTIEFIEPV